MRQSVSELSALTGMDRRKIRKVCSGLVAEKGPKGARMYDAREALPLLYGVEEVEGEEARLTRFRADKAEMELEALKGNMLQRDEVVREVQQMFGTVRSRLLSLPSKAAPEVATLDKPTKIQAHLKKFVDEALKELSDYG